MKSFKFTIDGQQFETTVNELEGNMAEVTVNGKSFQVAIEKEEAVAAPRMAAVAAAPRAAQAAGNQVVKSPLPGSIVKVLVKAGDKVNVGDTLLTMESMKMEIPVVAPQAGTVAAINVKEGDSVEVGDVLASLN